MTNAIPLIQLAAHQAGYNVSPGEIAALCAVGGVLIRWIPLEVKAIKAAGGIKNILAGLWSGAPAPAPVSGAPISPVGK